MGEAKSLQEQREQLIERLGVYMENQAQLAPLAARIFATLILTGKKGITFEELVTSLNASKSTVCTHLNTLQASGKADYFTKPGDRKRYFIVHPDNLVQVMDQMLKSWKIQQEIHQDILGYKEAVNKDLPQKEDKFDLEFHREYLEFTRIAAENIENLKEKLINKHLHDE